jgi:hypothetical protein
MESAITESIGTGAVELPAYPPTKWYCAKGHQFKAYPPDKTHIRAQESPCEEGKSIPKEYACEKKGCKEITTIHWDEIHGDVTFVTP